MPARRPQPEAEPWTGLHPPGMAPLPKGPGLHPPGMAPVPKPQFRLWAPRMPAMMPAPLRKPKAETSSMPKEPPGSCPIVAPTPPAKEAGDEMPVKAEEDLAEPKKAPRKRMLAADPELARKAKALMET